MRHLLEFVGKLRECVPFNRVRGKPTDELALLSVYAQLSNLCLMSCMLLGLDMGAYCRLDGGEGVTARDVCSRQSAEAIEHNGDPRAQLQ